jgi:WD40 repeat protein
MVQRLRVFISSPGDVPNERLRAGLVIDKLAQEYTRFFRIEAYRWEHEPMLASGHFQDAIEPPSAFDIVILILWSRLGTPLPDRTRIREYHGLDDRAPVTGTEWEFEEALGAARLHGAPDILAFRNLQPAPIDTADLEAQRRSLAQLTDLNAFWTRHFADRGVFLAAYENYRSLEEFARRFEETMRKLLDRRLSEARNSASDDAATWRGAPFRGLESYEFEHTAIFFGRDAVVAKAAERLSGQARAGSALLLVSGASGSGKSSLVKAALVPRLMKPQRIEGAAFLRRLVYRPSDGGGDVIFGFAEAMTRRGAGDDVGLPELLEPGQSAADFATHLRLAADAPGFLFATALARLTEEAARTGRILPFEQAKLLLVIDQLEELFTATAIHPDDQRLFIRLLLSLARSGAVWVVATIRADFWHRAAEIPEMVSLAEGLGRLEVAAPTGAELAEMIRRPAQAAGLAFEEHADRGVGLDAVLAEHAASAAGVLPLLSFTLEALYDEDIVKNGRRVLTFRSYDAIGGLYGAIAQRADATVESLPADARSALPHVLRALVSVSADYEQTSVARSVPLASFGENSRARAVIDALIRARLLVASSDGAQGSVRIAHEALISRWALAREQIAVDRRDIETRTLIAQQQARWRQAPDDGARDALLLRNPDLANAVDLDKRWGDEIDASLRSYIRRSDQAAKAAARRRWAVAATAMLVLAALTVSSLAALYFGERQRSRALVAQSRFLAHEARGLIDAGNATLGILLARAGLSPDLAAPERPYVADAEYALEDGIANRRERFVLSGHESTVWFAAYAPDGKRLVTVSDDRTARLWDAATGSAGLVLRGHEDSLTCAAFSLDGRLIATGSSDATVRIWDTATGRPVIVLHGHEDTVNSVQFSHDGKWLVTSSDDRTARVWDVQSGTASAVLRHDGLVSAAAFSPDDRFILTASTDGTARLWDAQSGALVRLLSGHGDFVMSAAFSPDGRRAVTASWDTTARIWDLSGAGAPIVLKGHTDRVVSAVFSPDGKAVLTAASDNTARLWNAATGTEVAVLKGHEDWVNSAVFSSDGSRIVTASDDGTVCVWDGSTGRAVGVLRGHDAAVNYAGFSPDGRHVVSASADLTARIWDTEISAADAVLRGQTGSIATVAFSPDGARLVTASNDKTAMVWDVRTQTVALQLKDHTDRVSGASFSGDGKFILTASWDRTARLWNAATGALVRVFADNPGLVTGAALSPDGKRLVTANSDGAARLWDLATGAVLVVLKGHESWLTSASFSPDGAHVVTTSWDKTARVWNATTGAGELVLKGHDGRVISAAYSPDGARIVTASLDHTARIWDAGSGAALAVLAGHDSWVYSASFSQDGRRVVTASDDRTVRVWDGATGAPILVLRGHGDAVRSAAFSPDDRRIATASADGTVRLWNLPPHCQTLLELARSEGARNATAAERARFGVEPAAAGGAPSWIGGLVGDWSARCE